MENKRKTVMKFMKDNLVFILSAIILCVMGALIAGRVLIWLQYDVKAINAEFVEVEDGTYILNYNGKTYNQINCWKRHGVPNETIEEKHIGRARGSAVVLYRMKEDPDTTILVGKSPTDVMVYSWKYDAFPTDGDVTGVELLLGIPGEHGEGSMYLTIKKEDFVKDRLDLFQRLWTDRYKNEPIECLHPWSIKNEVVIGCYLCFNGCPAPEMHMYIVRQDGQWYFIDEDKREGGIQSGYDYYAYAIDEPELVNYLNTYAETYITK